MLAEVHMLILGSSFVTHYELIINQNHWCFKWVFPGSSPRLSWELSLSQ